jgi:hypothetical protein
LSQDAGHSTPGEADKHDTAPLHDVSAHDVEPSWTARSWFDSGHDSARGHVHSFHFKDEISHLEASDVGLADGGHGPASNGHRGQAAGADGHQAISDEMQTIEPSLPGHHGHEHFNIGPGLTGSAMFAQVHHDLMV